MAASQGGQRLCHVLRQEGYCSTPQAITANNLNNGFGVFLHQQVSSRRCSSHTSCQPCACCVCRNYILCYRRPRQISGRAPWCSMQAGRRYCWKLGFDFSRWFSSRDSFVFLHSRGRGIIPPPLPCQQRTVPVTPLTRLVPNVILSYHSLSHGREREQTLIQLTVALKASTRINIFPNIHLLRQNPILVC